MIHRAKWRRVVHAGRQKAAPPLPNFLPFLDQWNATQRLTTPDLHRDIAGWLEAEWRTGGRHLLLLVFRDAGKSTLAGLFAAWLLLHDANTRILVLAADQALARKMVRTVRRIIERHPACGPLLPLRGGVRVAAAARSRESWAADQFTVRRDAVLRDPSMQARGIGANITGSRADVVICDDVEVPNTVASAEKRADLRARLAEIEFVLRPGGLQLYIGTPHSYYSIYADTPRHEAGEGQPFLAGFHRLVRPIVDASGTPAWPERFGPARIEALRQRSGPARFTSQMLLQPVSSSEARLDPEQLRIYDGEAVYLEAAGQPRVLLGDKVMHEVRCWWDPSFGAPDRGDGSAVAAVFLDGDGRWLIHDVAYVSHRNAPDIDAASSMCQQVATFMARHHVYSIHVENNGLGRFLPGILRRELARRGTRARVIEASTSEPKERRIMRALDAPLAAGLVLAHRRLLGSRFLAEMREWQPGGRGADDGLDAVASAMLAGPVRMAASAASAGPGNTGPDWRRGSVPVVAQSQFNPFSLVIERKEQS